MITFKSIGTHAITSALLATALGLFSDATLAKADSYFQSRSGDLISHHIAYSAARWPVYRNIHKDSKSVDTEFSSLEKKPDTAGEMQKEKRKTRGYHRRAPYGK